MSDKQLYITPQVLENLKSIKQKRLSLGLSRKALGQLLNVTEYSISLYERGIFFPKLGNYLKLAEIFHWNLDNDPNFLFSQCNFENLNKIKRSLAFSTKELSDEIFLSTSIIRKLFCKTKNRRCSIYTYKKVLDVLNHELDLIQFRKDYLHV